MMTEVHQIQVQDFAQGAAEPIEPCVCHFRLELERNGDRFALYSACSESLAFHFFHKALELAM